MNEQELVEKWLSVFGEGVDQASLEEHVTSYGNYLWHLFSWEYVSCLEKDEARNAFDAPQYIEAIRFCGGYNSVIENISVVEKVSAQQMDDEDCSDVYIVAKDFSWTYVRTHETVMCGPYLCMKK